uniref:Uncharacterized protein n=1 Tax=Anguilla anguilla TaxID=7936 RepID=A0A0E9W1H2_ANGAN
MTENVNAGCDQTVSARTARDNYINRGRYCSRVAVL